MLTGIHFLLTYTCTLECDHCFLHCGPHAPGTMTMKQITAVLQEGKKMPSVREVYFEGGEPFLFYPLMVEGIRKARKMGFDAGIVTNGYWATSDEDAEFWLRPLNELGVSVLSISDDELHHGEDPDSPAKCALAAALRLGMRAHTICIEKPELQQAPETGGGKGAPQIGGGTMLRGRAAEKLVEGLPTRPWREFRECPWEELVEPKRVHIGADGHVQACQGISIGNCWETPLSEIFAGYDAESHPICGPLVRGGPARLVEEYGLRLAEEYVTECHLCYFARRALLDQFPNYLAPRQAYGLEE
jgi:hypothetical protein